MKNAIVGLGSNMGDRKEMLRQALERISFACKILSISNVYETFSRHEEERNPYLNCCIEIQTDMTSAQLMQFLSETERQLNTNPTSDHYNHTSIDCDLISMASEVILTPQLTLPHPEAYRRAFVMIPLAEISPDWVHPILNQKAKELAKTAYWPGWGNFFADGKSLLDF